MSISVMFPRAFPPLHAAEGNASHCCPPSLDSVPAFARIQALIAWAEILRVQLLEEIVLCCDCILPVERRGIAKPRNSPSARNSRRSPRSANRDNPPATRSMEAVRAGRAVLRTGECGCVLHGRNHTNHAARRRSVSAEHPKAASMWRTIISCCTACNSGKTGNASISSAADSASGKSPR